MGKPTTLEWKMAMPRMNCVSRKGNTRRGALLALTGACCAIAASWSRPIPAQAEDVPPGPSPAGLSMDPVVQAMALSPGAAVLEISPSGGALAIPLARAAGKSGSVVEAAFAPRAAREPPPGANPEQPAGLQTVPIAKWWDDAFYADRRFDAVLLNDVFEKMADPRRQLEGFRRVLGPTGGRLFVLRRDFLPEFDAAAIPDPGGMATILKSFGDGSPFHARLPDDLRIQLEASPPANEAEMVAGLVVFLNRCLNDQGLYEDVSRYYGAKTEIASEFMSEIPSLEDAMLVCALLHNYHRAFDAGATPQTPQQKLAVYTVNHLLLTCIFRLSRTAPFYADPGPYCPDDGLPALFAEAGFETIGKTRFPPDLLLWEFKPGAAEPAAGGTPP